MLDTDDLPAKTERPKNPPKPPGVDVPRLRKTVEWAYEQWQRAERGEPSEWNQGTWIDQRMFPTCSTVCCIAGKIALDDGWTPTTHDGSVVTKPGKGERVTSVLALELLGIANDRLFRGSNDIWDIFEIAGELTDGEIEPPPGLPARPMMRIQCPCGCGLLT